ncbi:MAG TPA: DinB family protein [Chthonomonadaceae bacterium]|nr:DinB family protein [Chthonomonadaceae bacterium]
MNADASSLMSVYSGWDGYQISLVNAITPLSREQLVYRPTQLERSVGDIAAHIAFGRIDWFHRMGAQGSAELVEQAAPFWRPWGPVDSAVGESADEIVRWLNASWQMIENTLTQWTIDDLTKTFLQPYGGKTYAIPRQWVIWRIMAHDIHHGGQLSILLAEQGIELPELRDQGGHIVEVPLAELS